ncbi:transmembrane protein 74 [Rhincodon typus]|uniref:transmembrane protein 74 n=1 Tax=Rhincodon typus TaxID=259920 RepID=UPI0009A326C5|nr:transmembrane protein 74 [Rhincodon typus]
MASVELVYLGEGNSQPCAWKELEWGLHASFPCLSGSAPGTAPYDSYSYKQEQRYHPAGKDIRVCCCDQELETSFTYVDENVNLQRASPTLSDKSYTVQSYHGSSSDIRTIPEGLQELSIESDGDSSSESSDTSVDYGFISALLFLFSGITLVIISYVIPRDVTVNPDSVSAREMENLQKESARVGAHLDRCVIAGLGLLTLGGILLSILLMISICKGELYRRQRLAAVGRSGKIYGSFSFRLKSPGPNSSMQRFPMNGDDTMSID